MTEGDFPVDFPVHRRSILCSGLGSDRADLVVVTQVSHRPWGSPYPETSLDCARLNAVVPKSASRDGQLVLNADDEGCVQIGSKASVGVMYFTMDPGNPVVGRHVRVADERSSCDMIPTLTDFSWWMAEERLFSWVTHPRPPKNLT